MPDKTRMAAKAVVQTGDAICTSGFVGIGVPEALLVALQTRFLETGEPRDLILCLRRGKEMAKSEVSMLFHKGAVEEGGRRSLGINPKVGGLAVEGTTLTSFRFPSIASVRPKIRAA
jgi:propionate CoA-transferase